MAEQYGRVERALASALSRLPKLKQKVKRYYSFLVFLVYRKQGKQVTAYALQRCQVGQDQSFFGYYDKCPENESGDVLMHLKSQGSDVLGVGTSISVCLFSPENKSIPKVLIPTMAWNWQQGARAHWLDSERFIFNDLSDDGSSYVARVYSSDGSFLRSYSKPVAESCGSDCFLSVDFRRLSMLAPDYGYFSLPPISRDELDRLDDDGIWKVEFSSGEPELLYSYSDICSASADQIPRGAQHTVNHLTCAPDCAHFYFVHRFYVHGRRFDRLLLGSTDRAELKLLTGVGVSSHFCWLDNDRIFGYMGYGGYPKGYYIVDVKSTSAQPVKWLNELGLGDGHPTFAAGKVVVDTYPNKARMQQLLMLDLASKKIERLGEFYHGFSFWGENRCDLHPRLNKSADTVYLDSVSSGERQMYRLVLN